MFSDAFKLVFSRRPEALLLWMSAAMPLTFSLWSALLNNFTYEQAAFTGVEIGLLHTIREIPGFLAFSVAFLLIFIKEQRLAYLTLIVLALGSAITGHYPFLIGLLATTFISSVGFHYFVPVTSSLSLQWLSKDQAPIILGWMGAVGAGASLAAYGTVILLTQGGIGWGDWSLPLPTVPYWALYWVGGLFTLAVVAYSWLRFPIFEAKTPQKQEIILRKRYWLYYVLEFCSGARRQIFVVFAGFMLVERFGVKIYESTWILLAASAVTMVCAPLVGWLVARYGEQKALIFEYVGLIVIFTAYAFVPSVEWAIALYIIDHFFFSFYVALKTYFQKIADPADIAGSAGMAFTINHIAAVFLPLGLGYIWITSNAAVFLIGAGVAACSLVFAILIPDTPKPGAETRLRKLSKA